VAAASSGGQQHEVEAAAVAAAQSAATAAQVTDGLISFHNAFSSLHNAKVAACVIRCVIYTLERQQSLIQV
jgi:hypothetical protein